MTQVPVRFGCGTPSRGWIRSAVQLVPGDLAPAAEQASRIPQTVRRRLLCKGRRPVEDQKQVRCLRRRVDETSRLHWAMLTRPCKGLRHMHLLQLNQNATGKQHANLPIRFQQMKFYARQVCPGLTATGSSLQCQIATALFLW